MSILQEQTKGRLASSPVRLECILANSLRPFRMLIVLNSTIFWKSATVANSRYSFVFGFRFQSAYPCYRLERRHDMPWNHSVWFTSSWTRASVQKGCLFCPVKVNLKIRMNICSEWDMVHLWFRHFIEKSIRWSTEVRISKARPTLPFSLFFQSSTMPAVSSFKNFIPDISGQVEWTFLCEIHKPTVSLYQVLHIALIARDPLLEGAKQDSYMLIVWKKSVPSWEHLVQGLENVLDADVAHLLGGESPAIDWKVK